MPTARFIHDGDAIDYTPTVDTPAGTVVVIDSLIGITKIDIPANTLGAVHVTGVFDFPKPTGADTGSGAGINVYWHEAEQVAKRDATGGGKLLGKSTREATDNDAIFRVRLTQ